MKYVNGLNVSSLRRAKRGFIIIILRIVLIGSCESIMGKIKVMIKQSHEVLRFHHSTGLAFS